ncbi:DMT family transporter [Micromonospora sp. NBC_01813]|uniref:DMT family transporter n=1 Tax=Micromonospora sp. NBC_01813 TaxID=2975988 RepID=UPI002DD97E3E|nr:multidrug efflux SMR transporter [Micromonospora sp. NBC_01813]WSA11669.1 multidrug efflux SMR transporter [Micromonospora sp. NBC_01813]
MAWILLAVAGVLETGFALALKQSAGFTRLVPSVFFVVFAAGSFGLLALALRDLPVGTAYAVWTGIGAAGTAIVGILWYGDPSHAARLVSIALIVAGVVGLRLFHGS